MRFEKLCLCFVLLVVLVLPFISGDVKGCCLEPGKSCEDDVDADVCDGENDLFNPTSCSGAWFCDGGCCYDSESGTCDNNVYESACDAVRESWEGVSCDNLAECEEGCYILGDAIPCFDTEGHCEGIARDRGFEDSVELRGGVGEEECIRTFEVLGEGACVLYSGGCKFGSGDSCPGSVGEFSEGKYCSAVSGSGCEKTDNTMCVDGKDDVYYVDSCGNEAGVAEDCDRFEKGTACASALLDGMSDEVDGDFYCRDTSCEFGDKDYDHGESWCSYEGKVGDGDDVVGSRHWRYVCNDGEVEYGGCDDRREKICVQNFLKGEEGEGRVEATCVNNEWRDCLEYNDEENEEKVVEDCVENPFCEMRNVIPGVTTNKGPFGIPMTTDVSFSFSICGPKYPAGFDLLAGEGEDFRDTEEYKEDVCGRGSATCTYVMEDSSKLHSDWKCVENCGCKKAEFAEQMNEVCAGLGDCGGYVNYVGNYSDDGYSFVVKKKVKDSDFSDSYGDRVESDDDFIIKMSDYLDEGAGFVSPGVGSYDIKTWWDKRNWGDAVASTAGVAAITYVAATASSVAATAGVGTAATYAGAVMASAPLAPLAIVVFAAVSVDMIDDALTRTRKKKVVFTCESWEPVSGGDRCGECNEDDLKPCSEYRCESLGATCEIVNREEMVCGSSRDDGETPKILRTLPGAIPKSSDTCFDAYTDVLFGIETSEPAECRWSLEAGDFKDMEDFGEGGWLYEHKELHFLPYPGHVNAARDPEEDEELDWDLNFYFKCKDKFGHESVGFYEIGLCVKEEPDISHLGIVSVLPGEDELVGYDSDSEKIVVVVREPSECRWSLSDVEYSLMEDNMNCDLSSFVCNGTVPVEGVENVYYISCMDQPWLDNISDMNEERRKHVLRRPESRIAVDWVEVGSSSGYDSGESGKLVSATDRKDIDLQVGTSGGGTEHVCSWSFSKGDKEYGPFAMKESGEVGKHGQGGIGFDVGSHRIDVECEDVQTGDVALGSVEFEITKSTFDIEITPIDDFDSDPSQINYVDLVVESSGDGEDHNCNYSVGDGEYIEFDMQGGVGAKSQEVEVGIEEVNISVRCENELGDFKSETVSFYVKYDEYGINIARVWQDGGRLHVVTVNDVECRFSEESCDFDWDDGESAGEGVDHSIGVVGGGIYFIKCENRFGKVPGDCSVTARTL